MARLFGDPYDSVSDVYLRRACRLAELGRGTTSPNPLVGCVLVREGQVVGEGWHAKAGLPHAEAVALAAAGEQARGCTAYVTLEPCAHQGRTPPCADALIRAGVERVVVGMRDPNPVARGGADVLGDAGIAVEYCGDPRPFQELNAEWLHTLTTGRPFVRVKIALTLDGRPTLACGVRSELTGEAARALTMRLRAGSDAVLVGSSTARIDDPSLTVRDADGRPAPHQPRRVVLTRTEQPPAELRMLRDGLGPVTVLLPDAVELDDALVATGASAVEYETGDGLEGALRALAADGVVSLLVEAGPHLFDSLYDLSLIDELVMLHAGGLAGEEAPALYTGVAPEDATSLVRRMRAVEAGLAGNDAVTVWRPVATTD
jgi:diaminohydroxyphosphoribosylaminopyrimidine deaminase / 5-amino-6-(5-phosphoribosylamino)uracil reductase